MGCFVSTTKNFGRKRVRPRNIREVVVFVPGLRVPKSVQLSQPLDKRRLIERLSVLRTRIVVMAGQQPQVSGKPRRKKFTLFNGDTNLVHLQQALEDYLPVLMGLVQNGNQLKHGLQFAWASQEDHAQETTMSNVWYEVLSALHLMAMLSLSQANSFLLPRTTADRRQAKVSDESKRASIDALLKAAGFLDFALQHVLPEIPPDLRKDLPVDLAEGVLRALCQQALGQAIDIQLGMAIGSVKASLAVKRRLACEMVKYWHQAQENILNLPMPNTHGEKHKLFIKWKYDEAKAAAFYFHGLILQQGSSENSHEMTVGALQAADEFLNESKKSCESFNREPPLSRNPREWGTIKYLCENIPKDASRVLSNLDSYSHKMYPNKAPTLPEFELSLKPDEYQLPAADPTWNYDCLMAESSHANTCK